MVNGCRGKVRGSESEREMGGGGVVARQGSDCWNTGIDSKIAVAVQLGSSKRHTIWGSPVWAQFSAPSLWRKASATAL